MVRDDGLPEGVLLFRGEDRGRLCRERLIRETVGENAILLRFPVWEQAEEANALLREVMAKLYDCFRHRAQRETDFFAVARCLCTPREGVTEVLLQGYGGERAGCQLQSWARLCFSWEGKCPCLGVKILKKRRKNAKEDRIC